MICLSKLSEAEEAILLGLFAMGARKVRLFEYGNAHDVMRRAIAPVDSPLQWLPRAEHLLDARG